MKKIISTITFLLYVFSSCQMQELDAPYHEGKFTAKFESFNAQTKTSIHIDNKLAWSEGDQIAIFQGTATGMKYQIVDSSVGTDQATFTFVGENSGDNDFTLGTVVDANIAVYPYSDDLTFTVDDADGVVYTINNIEIPSVQEYAGASFANGAFPMVAVTSSLSEKNLIFKNLIGVLKLSLKGPYKVMGVEIEGNDGEDLAGRLSVTAYSDNGAPSMMFQDNTSKKVVLDCGDGVQLYEDHATDFYIALPPVRFEKGFKVTITDSEYQKYSVETHKANTIFRSSILTMPGVGSDQYQYEGVDVYIDEYGINHGPGIEIDGVIWAPVNCGYHETNYPYGKRYQWGRKYGQWEYTWKKEKVSLEEGQSEDNSMNHYFYYHEYPNLGKYEYSHNWLDKNYNDLWNDGTIVSPVRTIYDPCPDGWRVPTERELKVLVGAEKSDVTTYEGVSGVWYSGSNPLDENSFKIFLPSPYCVDVNPQTDGIYQGFYWTSTPHYSGNYATAFSCEGGFFVVDMSKHISCPIRCVQNNDAILIKIIIPNNNLLLSPGTSAQIHILTYPDYADDKTLTWTSSNPSVATVDKNGTVTALVEGTATISVEAKGKASATCVVNVGKYVVNYIDEYNINHGGGIYIDGVVWAPVNCGYKAATQNDKGFPFGKLYQWGRKYGQGYTCDYDENSPDIMNGPINLAEGQQETNSNVFYTGALSSNKHWLHNENDTMWNAGTESNPVKNVDNDPCPSGWRVPTYNEMSALIGNFMSWEEKSSQYGFAFFNRSQTASVFLAAAGLRNENGEPLDRDNKGYYWSSNVGMGIKFSPNSILASQNNFNIVLSSGCSIRCVQNSYVNVSSLTMDVDDLVLDIGGTYSLCVDILPETATDKTIQWSSSDEKVIEVDQEGNILAKTYGKAIITVASINGISASCTVTVEPLFEYVDEYGINHGRGILVDNIVWAPVNCGYKEGATDDKGFPYGKLYQWGRRFGQGYSLEYDSVAFDTSYANYVEDGQKEVNKDLFYIGTWANDYSWVDFSKGFNWHDDSNEGNKKVHSDPCPNGWRVPTLGELKSLMLNKSSWMDHNNQPGYWFSGSKPFNEEVSAVFLPAAGYISVYGDSCERESHGEYWSNSSHQYCYFHQSNVGNSAQYNANGCSVRCVLNENGTEDRFPVETMSFNKSKVTVELGSNYSLHPIVYPENTTDNNYSWSSSDPSVATVDDSGHVVTCSVGHAVISVTASNGISTSCEINVEKLVNYIDEWGINHGLGTYVDGVVWAPVNCGYKAPTQNDKGFPYGKLYQWGRRYGQGYSEEYDMETPNLFEGSISLKEGQKECNKNVFYIDDENWLNTYSKYLWNKGDEDAPIKSAEDPCPEGWRVPTYKELESLARNYSSWITSDTGYNGYYMSGEQPYSESVPQSFLIAAGYRMWNGTSENRNEIGSYWSSTPPNSSYGKILCLENGKITSSWIAFATGCSVRCVQDYNDLGDFFEVESIDVTGKEIIEVGEKCTLNADIYPENADDKKLSWMSSNESVAFVDQTGKVEALSPGNVTITALSPNGVKGTFALNVKDVWYYRDEYGVNHGAGIEIDGIVWAPVNCGYKSTNDNDKGFPYGKLYQWGRRYGQGYSEEYDEETYILTSGPISIEEGQLEANRNVFYNGDTSTYQDDWALVYDNSLWNTGSSSSPIKTSNDPCPDGWRVPTIDELTKLNKNHSDLVVHNGQYGIWYSGSTKYNNDVNRVFLPAAGLNSGNSTGRDAIGVYWSSTKSDTYTYYSYSLYFYYEMFVSKAYRSVTSNDRRFYGCSVRCVLDD